MEAYKVEKAIGKTPFLRIETDYSMGDMGQLKTRVDAFLEMLGMRTLAKTEVDRPERSYSASVKEDTL